MMGSERIQNSIIRKVLNTKDEELLDYLNQLLSAGEGGGLYELSADEKTIVSESLADYKSGKIISNEEVTARNGEWLKE